MQFVKFLPAAIALMFGAVSAHAALSVNSGTYSYSQSFDSLAASGSNAWTNDSTLAGWSLFNKSSSAVSTYSANDGASNAGAFYSYGSAGSSERALGGLGSGGSYFGSPASGAVAGWIAVAFQNNSGSALKGFELSFDGEQWRNGGNASKQSMVLQYGFGSTFSSVTSWSAPGASFDWISPVASTSAAAVNGNVAGKATNLGGTINASWNVGDTLWVRWTENNDVGNDHGLAIDNFKMSVVAVPEPETYALFLAGLGLLGFAARRRNK